MLLQYRQYVLYHGLSSLSIHALVYTAKDYFRSFSSFNMADPLKLSQHWYEVQYEVQYEP